MIPHRTIFSGFRIPSERPDLRSERSDLRSERSDKPDLRSDRSDLQSERQDLKSIGGYVRTDGIRKPEKIVLCGIIDYLPLRGRCPKTEPKTDSETE